MWAKEKLIVDDFTTSISDFVIKYRTIDIVIDVNNSFDYEIMFRLQAMGYKYIWLPCIENNFSFLTQIIKKVKFNQKRLLIFSSNENKNIIKLAKIKIDKLN